MKICMNAKIMKIKISLKRGGLEGPPPSFYNKKHLLGKKILREYNDWKVRQTLVKGGTIQGLLPSACHLKPPLKINFNLKITCINI